MEVPIIRIGNSKGIRLAKTILERYQMTDYLEIIFKDGYLILKPARRPREGWEEAFNAMHESGEDALLIDDIFEDEQVGE